MTDEIVTGVGVGGSPVNARPTPLTVGLIGAPTDIGAPFRGASLGPEALRIAGIEQCLSDLEVAIVDHGALAGPANPEAPSRGGYRHLAEVAAWSALVRDEVHEALRSGELPIVMGGDHCLAIGSIAGIATHCAELQQPLSVVWLDAHADFNTPQTSPSGNIHGMPVAILCGHGPAELLRLVPQTPIVDPAHLFVVGTRSVDAHEKIAISSSGVRIFDMRTIDERGIRSVLDEILTQVAETGGHLHVSFDVDFLDPMIAPGVATMVPGGPSYREAQLCMEMIHDSGLMRSLDIMELTPSRDTRNQTAELVVELVASLFGEQILSRHRRPGWGGLPHQD